METSLAWGSEDDDALKRYIDPLGQAQCIPDDDDVFLRRIIFLIATLIILACLIGGGKTVTLLPFLSYM